MPEFRVKNVISGAGVDFLVVVGISVMADSG